MLGGGAVGRAGSADRHFERLHRLVSIPPQRYIVERMGGQAVEVRAMVRAGESPATYQPKPSQTGGLSSADAYFTIGVPFEHAWIGRRKSMIPGVEWLDLGEGIKHLQMPHPAGKHADHPHQEALGAHIWLSPRLIKKTSHHRVSCPVPTAAGELGSDSCQLGHLVEEHR